MQRIFFLIVWSALTTSALGQTAGRIYRNSEFDAQRLALLLTNFSGDSIYADFGLEARTANEESLEAAGYLIAPSGNEYAIVAEERFKAVFTEVDSLCQLRLGRFVFREGVERASHLHIIVYAPDSVRTFEAIKPIPAQPGQCAVVPPVCAPILPSAETISMRTDGRYGYAKRYPLIDELPVPPFIQKNTSQIIGKALAFKTIKDFSKVEHEKNLLYNYTGARRRESGSWYLTQTNALRPGLDSTLRLKTLAYLFTPKEQRRADKCGFITEYVNDFWRDCAKKSKFKSEELSRAYYERARYANLHFTNKKIGWLADRGMIYMLFGQPDELSISPKGEYWKYENAPGYDSPVAFEFVSEENELEELRVVKNLSYQPFWFAAIAQWRNGNISIYE